MKNRILFLESGYNLFFTRLAKEYEKPYFLSSTYSHRFIYSLGLGEVFKCEPLSVQHAEKIDIKIALKIQIRGFVRGENTEPLNFEDIVGAVNAARIYLAENKIELIYLHNHLRFMHSVFAVVGNELGIPSIVFERGLFRPHTTTIDIGGVNADGSMLEQYKYWKPFKYAELKFEEKSNGFESIRTRLIFLAFRLLIALEVLFSGKSKLAYYPKSFVEMFSIIKNKLLRRKNKHKSLTEKAEKVVVIALQLETDTQLQLNSSWHSNVEFLYHLNAEIGRCSSGNLQFVYTQHPLDPSKPLEFQYIKHSNSPTSSLLEDAIGLITINSTVGIEALRKKLPICILGRAGYLISDACMFTDLNLFISHINGGLNLTDFEFENRRDFTSFLKHEYQLNMNLYDENKDDPRKVIAKVDKLIRHQYEQE